MFIATLWGCSLADIARWSVHVDGWFSDSVFCEHLSSEESSCVDGGRTNICISSELSRLLEVYD